MTIKKKKSNNKNYFHNHFTSILPDAVCVRFTSITQLYRPLNRRPGILVFDAKINHRLSVRSNLAGNRFLLHIRENLYGRLMLLFIYFFLVIII